MIAARCVPEHELLPVAEGESASPEIADHLEQCESCRRRLEQLKSEMQRMRSLLRNVDPNELLQTQDIARARPTSIGRYLVLGLLDEGGQAVVYRAMHPTLNKDLVIKWGLRPLSGGDQQRNLLVKEGQLLAELDHPGIARVYDLDFFDDRPFLAVEYVRGMTLEAYAKQHRPGPAESARIVAGVARAAAAAHRRGIVHQDIKPRNILVDEMNQPRLIDFGMARIRSAWAEGPDDESSLGGTVAYMPPEQARNDTGQIGAATDVFALGGVLYFLLAGKPPYSGRTVGEVLERARRCDYDRDALRAAGAPRRLAAICLRAMDPSPAARFASAELLARALERWAARPRGLRRALAAAVLAAAVAAGGIYAWQHHGPGPLPSPAPVVSQNQDLLQILRADEPISIRDALPLQNGDRVQASFDVPAGWNWLMLAVNTGGVVEQLKPEVLPGPAGVVRLKYPPAGKSAPLDPTSGTELILVCAAPRPLQFEPIRQILDRGQPLPALGGRVYVRLTLDEVRAYSGGRGRDSSLGGAAETQLGELEALLERVRAQLRAQQVEVAGGIAFPHVN